MTCGDRVLTGECSVLGCDWGVDAGHEHCAKHRERLERYGDPCHVVVMRDRACAVDGCGRGARVRGVCTLCYKSLSTAIKSVGATWDQDEIVGLLIAERASRIRIGTALSRTGYGSARFPVAARPVDTR